jgi:hypothetical protein
LDSNDHCAKTIQSLTNKGHWGSNLKIKRKHICFSMGISYITSFSTFMRHELCVCHRKIGRHLLPKCIFLHIYGEIKTKTSVCMSFLRLFLPLPVNDGASVAYPFSLFFTCSSMLSVFLEFTHYPGIEGNRLAHLFCLLLACVQMLSVSLEFRPGFR